MDIPLKLHGVWTDLARKSREGMCCLAILPHLQNCFFNLSLSRHFFRRFANVRRSQLKLVDFSVELRVEELTGIKPALG